MAKNDQNTDGVLVYLLGYIDILGRGFGVIRWGHVDQDSYIVLVELPCSPNYGGTVSLIPVEKKILNFGQLKKVKIY
jgi:hypothetical protein